MNDHEPVNGAGVANPPPVAAGPVTAGERSSMTAAVGYAHTRMLGDVFHTIAGEIAETGRGQWRFRLPGSKRKLQATLSDQWLKIALPLRALPGLLDYSGITAMLDRNARTHGCSRVIGDGLAPRRNLIIEFPADLLPWECEAELEALLSAMVAELGAAAGLAARAPTAAERPELPPDRLASVFDEAGWPAQSAGDLDLEVPLDVPGHYLAARVDQAAGTVWLSAPLPLELGPPAVAGATAATVLLWAVACRVRLVRPVCRKGVLGLEAALPRGPAPTVTAGHICAALSLAAQQVLPEANQLLADDALAALYLANMGFESAS